MKDILQQIANESLNSSITDWIMVAITVVYVIATIFISISNHKSAKASNKQIEEMKKQQEQNVAIQLYEKRLSIFERIERFCESLDDWEFDLSKFSKISKNEIVLLFDDEANNKYEKIYSFGKEINMLQGDCDYASKKGSCNGKSEEDIEKEILELADKGNIVFNELKDLVFAKYLKL